MSRRRTDAERVPPHDLDAERAVLGAVLTHAELLDLAAGHVGPAEFYRDAHRRIFAAMLGLSDRNAAVDFLTLREALERAGELEAVGGPAYLSALSDGVPHSTNVEHYARVVREKAARRDVIAAATRLLAAAYAEDDAETGEPLDAAEAALARLHGSEAGQELRRVSALLPAVLASLERAHADPGAVPGVATGLDDLDRMVRGFREGQLVVLAGRPGEGKTALALQVARHVSRTGTVAFYTLEMSAEELVLRMITSAGGIDGHRLTGGYLGSRDWAHVSHAFARVGDTALWIDETPARSVRQIRAGARRLRGRHGLVLLVVDYLQLVSPVSTKRDGDSRTQEVADITRAFKTLAKELRVPVLVVSQLTRAPEQGHRRPRLSDLRESGAIEQDADVVLFIYHQPVNAQGEGGGAEVIVGKQRNGPTGAVKVLYQREFNRFENLAQEPRDARLDASGG